jgi:hypothetical protein
MNHFQHLAIKEMKIKTTLKFFLPCQIGHPQENKQQQMLVRMWSEKATLIPCLWEYKLL